MTGRAAATSAAMLLLLLAATSAAAQWRDGRGGGWGAEGRRYESAQPYGGREDAAPGWGRRPGGGYGGYGDRGSGGGYGAYGGYGRPGAGDGAAGLRRGQVVPPAYRGAYVPDPGRYHLRAAPPGYGWVGDGRNAYLTQRSTGMVLDAVPRAYEPAPAWRRGGGGGRGRGPR